MSYILGVECAVLRKTANQLLSDDVRAEVSASLGMCRSMFGKVYLLIDASQVRDFHPCVGFRYCCVRDFASVVCDASFVRVSATWGVFRPVFERVYVLYEASGHSLLAHRDEKTFSVSRHLSLCVEGENSRQRLRWVEIGEDAETARL